MKRIVMALAGAGLTSLALAAQLEAGPGAASAQAEIARPSSSAQIGRLFFTPSERVQLDLARAQKKPPPPIAAAAEPVEPPPTPQTVTYGGIIRRSDGRSMLWINNRLVDEKEALAGLNLKGKVQPNGAVTLQVPQTGASINVKVGQSVEVMSGKVAETRKPDPESKPPATDAKGGAAEAKPGTADAKSAAADGKPPAADAKAPAPSAAGQSNAQTADRRGDSPSGVGLKLDTGSRRLEPAESQRITGK